MLRDGAVLDCDGHTIRGSRAPRSAPTAPAATYGGIILDGTRGARRPELQGHRLHVRHRAERRARQPRDRQRGLPQRRLPRARGVRHPLQPRGRQHDRELHRPRQRRRGHPHRRRLRPEHVVGNESYDNGRENFYILSARGNRLARNRGRGRVSANLYMKHAVDNVVEGNRFEERPVVVRGRVARGNVFADNVLGGGVKFESYREGQTEDAPDRATSSAAAASSAAARASSCIEARDNRVEEVALEGCSGDRGAGDRARRSNDLLGVDVVRRAPRPRRRRDPPPAGSRPGARRGARPGRRPSPARSIEFRDGATGDAATVSTDSTGTATDRGPDARRLGRRVDSRCRRPADGGGRRIPLDPGHPARVAARDDDRRPRRGGRGDARARRETRRATDPPAVGERTRHLSARASPPRRSRAAASPKRTAAPTPIPRTPQKNTCSVRFSNALKLCSVMRKPTTEQKTAQRSARSRGSGTSRCAR